MELYKPQYIKLKVEVLNILTAISGSRHLVVESKIVFNCEQCCGVNLKSSCFIQIPASWQVFGGFSQHFSDIFLKIVPIL